MVEGTGVEAEALTIAVEEGEEELMHVASSVMPTVLISEVPPCRPLASTSVNNIDVPAATLAFQS